MACATATLAATVMRGAADGLNLGRSSTENNKPLAAWRNPRAAMPAAAFGLRLGEDDKSFPGLGARHVSDDIVGRRRFLEHRRSPGRMISVCVCALMSSAVRRSGAPSSR